MKKLNLLLLEDSTDDAELVIQMLKRSGIDCDIKVVCYEAEYTSELENYAYDLILADNALPQFDATHAIDIMHALNLDIPFILVTGSMSEEFAVEIMKNGAWDYILKDRLGRLPNAVISAYSKSELLREKQRNIDERLKSETLMKKAESLAHFGSWEEDREKDTVRWSEEYYRILGYEPGEVAANHSNFIARVHPDSMEFVQQEIARAMKGMDKHNFDCKILAADSDIRHVKCELAITRNEAGKIIRINGLNKDITAVKQAEERLKQSEANLRTIFDHSDTGYILLDVNCRIVSFNKIFDIFAKEQLGMPLVEGTPVVGYVKGDAKQALQAAIDSALKNVAAGYEVPIRQADDSLSWFHIYYHPVWGGDSGPLGVIISEADITPRKLLELQEKKITRDLIQRKNELEQFTYIISHNLRAPVANIMGITAILGNDFEYGDDQRSLLDGMRVSVEKLDGVIADLNQIIQLKQGLSEKKELLKFSQLVEDIKIVINNVITASGVQIKYSFGELDTVMTIRSFMHSIFYNLISNSIKYRQPGRQPVIEITSHVYDSYAELVFTDNGVGIDLHRKGSMLFGLYKRFHTELAEGKGIGLFMVKTHIESLGGTISVASEVNKGTRFTIRFDLADLQ